MVRIKPYIRSVLLTIMCGMLFPLSAHAEWIKGHTVTLQALDKITARISTIDIPVGSPHRYGALSITIHSCTTRPPTMAPENAALLEIRSVDHNNVISDTPIFQGWMFASSPGLNALEHPVYDVSVLACIKD